MLHPGLEYFITPEHANERDRVNGMKSSPSHRPPPMVHISLSLTASGFIWSCQRVLRQVVEVIESFQDILDVREDQYTSRKWADKITDVIARALVAVSPICA